MIGRVAGSRERDPVSTEGGSGRDMADSSVGERP
jgi:hypothetical protein